MLIYFAAFCETFKVKQTTTNQHETFAYKKSKYLHDIFEDVQNTFNLLILDFVVYFKFIEVYELK